MPAQPLPHLLEIDGVRVELDVLQFEGHEGMSQLFEFEVAFASAIDFDFASIVRKGATLTVEVGDDDTSRLIKGIVSRAEQTNVGRKSSEYRLTLVPHAWLLLHRMDCRIFQTMTVPQIVEAVLKGAGLSSGDDYKLSLRQTYVVRDYCVQYRESDWDFVSRLLEEEGIYYFIDTTKDVLVFGDDTGGYPPIAGKATLDFRPGAGALGGTTAPGDHVLTFQFAEHVRSGKTTLRDWNFLKPALSLEASKVASVNDDLELYDFPGEYQAKADGDTIAQTRLQEQGAGVAVGGGDSTCSRLAPGNTFTLAEHDRESFNANYVVTRVSHRGTNAEAQKLADGEGPEEVVYNNQFEVIPASTLFRPPRVTRRPHIHGVQTAQVVGPAGEEIYVDENCRVKVQFHWDRKGALDDKSSCWVRVAQSWASQSFGAMFIPRIKDEVVVTFLEGDPDQPLIVGSIYHGTNVPPYGLPANKTRSTIKSKSSPQGGDGYNELRFEDKKGSEEVYIHGQKDWTILIENDKNQTVGHDETAHVKHDRTKNVDNDQTATIGHDDTLEVKNDQTMTVDHDQSLTVKNNRTTTVQRDHTETVSGNQSITVTKAQTVAISDKQDITVSKKRSLTVNDDVSETFAAKLTLSVTGDVSETMSAKRTVSVSGDHSESVGGKESISITGDSVETVGGKKTFTVTGNVTITSGSSTVTIKPSGEISIAGVKMSIDASGPLEISGATVDVKSDGPATFKGAAVTSSADAAYTLKGAMITLDGQMISVG
jgi:type VI secretion system secreted protein VgrG